MRSRWLLQLCFVLLVLLPPSLVANDVIYEKVTNAISTVNETLHAVAKSTYFIQEGLHPSCGRSPLTEFADCCSEREVVNEAGKNYVGVLPSTFTLARGYTDLSSNPHLCGVISQLPAAPPDPCPVKLIGSHVQLDLAAVASSNDSVGPLVVRWLGAGALNHSNLREALPPSQAYKVCLLLEQGELSVLETLYGSGSTTGCKAAAQTATRFPNQEAWDACHALMLQLRFGSAEEQARALEQYNNHMLEEDPAFVCGHAGFRWRRRLMGITWAASWAISIVACLLIYLLMRCCSCCCSGGESGCCRGCGEDCFDCQSCSRCWGCGLPFAGYAALHLFDMVTDWWYVFTVAGAGNLTALLQLGWLYVAGYLLLLAVFVWFLAIVAPRVDEDLASFCRILAVVFVPYLSAGVVLLALATTNMTRFLGPAEVSTGDTLFTAKVFLGFAIGGQFLICLVTFVLRGGCMLRGRELGPERDMWLATDLPYLIIENVPQLLIQTYLWITGKALVSTFLYILSTLSSIAGLAWSVTYLAICLHRDQLHDRSVRRHERSSV